MQKIRKKVITFLSLFVFLFVGVWLTIIKLKSSQATLTQSQSLLSRTDYIDNPSSIETLIFARKQLQETISKLEKIPSLVQLFDYNIQVYLSRLRSRLNDVEQKIKIENQALANIENAKKLFLEVNNKLQNSSDGLQAFDESIKKIQEATKLLNTIPGETFVSSQAKNNLIIYQAKYIDISKKFTKEERALASLQTAQELAQKAFYLTKDQSSYTVKTLQDAQSIWQQAIDLLKNVPSDTSVSSEVKGQLRDYEDNFQSINVSLKQLEQCVTTNIESPCGDISLKIITPINAVASSTNPDNEEVSSTASSDSTDSSDSSTSISSSDSTDRSTSTSSYNPGFIYIPKSSSGSTYVRGYYRSNGTYVQGHYRSSGGTRVSGFGTTRGWSSSS